MQSRKQIFCFTHAGGSASFFDKIESDLPEIEFVKIEYSGHGSRRKEPLYTDFTNLTDDVFQALKKEYKGEEYALFGYSMGTITLVEILKRILNESNMPLPKRVFLAAHEPITKAEFSGDTTNELNDWVKQRTIQFGTVPERLINNKSFWRMYLPLYCADYLLIGKYRFEKLGLKSEISATIFYSETDTPLRNMELWKKYFINKCNFHKFEGTHFFIQQHHREIAEIIQERLYRSENDDI